MMQEYLVPEEAAGTRIDKFLADACRKSSIRIPWCSSIRPV